MKMVKKFQLKIVIFTAVKYRCILHGNVCVMRNSGTVFPHEQLRVMPTKDEDETAITARPISKNLYGITRTTASLCKIYI